MSGNTRKLLTSPGMQIDELKDAIARTQEMGWVEYAIGSALDQIGAILGLARITNEIDAQYRSRLMMHVISIVGGATDMQIRQSASGYVNTSPDDVFVTKPYLKAPHDAIVVDHYAHIRVAVDIANREYNHSIDIAGLTNVINDNKPAGVTLDDVKFTMYREFTDDVLNDNLWITQNQPGSFSLNGSYLTVTQYNGSQPQITSDAFFEEQSFECYIRFNTSSQSSKMIGLRNGTSGIKNITIYKFGTAIYFETYEAASQVTTLLVADDNLFHHYYVTWTSTKVECYMDGVLKATHTVQVPTGKLNAYIRGANTVTANNHLYVRDFFIYGNISKDMFDGVVVDNPPWTQQAKATEAAGLMTMNTSAGGDGWAMADQGIPMRRISGEDGKMYAKRAMRLTTRIETWGCYIGTSLHFSLADDISFTPNNQVGFQSFSAVSVRLYRKRDGVNTFVIKSLDMTIPHIITLDVQIDDVTGRVVLRYIADGVTLYTISGDELGGDPSVPVKILMPKYYNQFNIPTFPLETNFIDMV